MGKGKGNGTLITFMLLVISVIWGQWKHADDERDKKAKKHSQAWRKYEEERAKRKKGL